MNRKKINSAIKELKSARLLDEKIATKLEVQEAKAPAFYMSPKMHKPKDLGRPVISFINCHMTSISQYVDHHLQRHVKDSTGLIKNNPGKIPANSIIVTMDFRSLYTNIPHKEDIKVVETALKGNNKQTRVIIYFLKLILTLNNFILNFKDYLQINGCAMETKCAPTYANIFMGIFEEH